MRIYRTNFYELRIACLRTGKFTYQRRARYFSFRLFEGWRWKAVSSLFDRREDVESFLQRLEDRDEEERVRREREKSAAKLNDSQIINCK